MYRSNIRLSVCPIDRQQQRLPTGLLLSVLSGRSIDIAVDVGSVTLTADVEGSTQTSVNTSLNLAN